MATDQFTHSLDYTNYNRWKERINQIANLFDYVLVEGERCYFVHDKTRHVDVGYWSFENNKGWAAC